MKNNLNTFVLIMLLYLIKNDILSRLAFIFWLTGNDIQIKYYYRCVLSLTQSHHRFIIK